MRATVTVDCPSCGREVTAVCDTEPEADGGVDIHYVKACRCDSTRLNGIVERAANSEARELMRSGT